MNTHPVEAWAPVNIALVKHWGFGEGSTLLPARESLSLTLEHGCRTSVEISKDDNDSITLNGSALSPDDGAKAESLFRLLSRIRREAGLESCGLIVKSVSEVPVSAGMASSAAGGAALVVAALEAAGLEVGTEAALLEWCRATESLSALRSLRGGVVSLTSRGDDLLLENIETELDLAVASCLVETSPKSVSSSDGHDRAVTSRFFPTFRAEGARAVERASRALARGDFELLGEIVESDALAMHAVMMTSQPPIFYATDATWAVWQRVRSWRERGLLAYCTLDAGANPHVISLGVDAAEIASSLEALPWVRSVLKSRVEAKGARVIS